MNELNRTVFETSRLLEFFSESELNMQMGQSKSWWPTVALKELIDNALDACENAGVAPKIGIDTTWPYTIVTDNAGGIPESVIKSSLDYLVRVSDKSYYISPTRGQLGNALKCIYAAPYVLSGERGHVRIETRGVSYDITIQLDRIAQAPSMTLNIGTAQSDCTKVMIEWPDSASLNTIKKDPFACVLYNTNEIPSDVELVKSFAILNPHAEFTFKDEVWQPTLTEWEKWKPCNPTSPHWYAPEQLRNLMAAYLTAERKNGNPRTVRELVAEFRGLSRTATQKKVTEDAGLHGAMLSDLVKEGDIALPPVERLLSAMKEQSKPVNAKLLGTIGKDHITTRMVADHHVEEKSIKYFRKVGKEPKEPYVLEIALGIYSEKYEGCGRTLITGLNWSPTMRTPIHEISQALSEMRIDRADPLCVVIHIAKPHFEFTERGKGHANV
jgi:DNA topoisomerase VI subunit B